MLRISLLSISRIKITPILQVFVDLLSHLILNTTSTLDLQPRDIAAMMVFITITIVSRNLYQ